MSAASTLYLIPSLRAIAGKDGDVQLTQKFVTGVLEYARRWNGQVVVLLRREDDISTNLDMIWISPDDMPFSIEWLKDDPIELLKQLVDARIVLGSLVHENTFLATLCADAGIPLVYITEYTHNTRCQIIDSQTCNPILRLRRKWWTTQLEQRYVQATLLATGVQCNGTPTYDAYCAINSNPLLYFDSRVAKSMLVANEIVEQRLKKLLNDQPIRLVFSGRLIAMKGADHLPLVAAELDKLGVHYEMDICGDGPLRNSIESKIHKLNSCSRIQMHGTLEFQRELLPLVSNHTDLFVCCHRQGDPSCTYLETMSCGVPIIGYDNEALCGIVKTSNVGWTTPLNKPKILASEIARLVSSRDELTAASRAALKFASMHTLEKTMDARIEHLLDCCRQRTIGAAA